MSAVLSISPSSLFVPVLPARKARIQPRVSKAARLRAEFEELAMPHAETLYALALRFSGNRATAEDLVQEAFIRAWKNFDRYERGTHFKAWLCRILYFVHQNEQRRHSKKEKPTDFSLGEPEDRAHAHAIGSGEALSYDHLVEDDLKRALDELDDDQRKVFLLVTLADLSYREIADLLAIPMGTVMSRLYRARQHLQKALA